jgi:hypothetical protein
VLFARTDLYRRTRFHLPIRKHRTQQGSCRARKVAVLENGGLATTGENGNTRPPVSREPIFLYSSLSFVDIALSFSSSTRILRRCTSLSNMIFHSLNDCIVTGVPRVRASSSYNDRLDESRKEPEGAGLTSKAFRSKSRASFFLRSDLVRISVDSCSRSCETIVKVIAIPTFSCAYSLMSVQPMEPYRQASMLTTA